MLYQMPCKADIWGAANNGSIERASDGEQLAFLQLASHEGSVRVAKKFRWSCCPVFQAMAG